MSLSAGNLRGKSILCARDPRRAAASRAMRDSGFFGGVAPATVAELRRIAQRRLYAPGETMFHLGDEPADIFAVESGRLKLWRMSDAGVPMVVAYGIAGDVIGLVGAMQRRPYIAHGTALTTCVATCWSVRQIRALMEGDAVLAINIAEALAERVGSHVARMEEMASLSVEERVARTLVRLAVQIGTRDAGGAVKLDIGQRDVADLARTTVPTFSRLAGRWARAGVLTGTRGRIVIHDQKALAALARTGS